jgi:hypothetical protein
MAESEWPDNVELSAFLADLDVVQFKLRVPPPIVVLVDDLLRQVPRRVGVKNASELIAALLLKARACGSETLGEAVGDYRECRVHDGLPTDETTGTYSMPARPNLDLRSRA